MLLREGSIDESIVGEIKREYSWMPVKDKVVLDVGGCFGGYTYHALKNGAAKVWCFEPEKENYDTILKNVELASPPPTTQCTVFNKALTTSLPSKIPFYLSANRRNRGGYSTFKYRGRVETVVDTANFKEVLKELRPEVIKMDCEGAEFDLLQDVLPDFVRYFTMELHFTSPSYVKPTWLEQSPSLLKQFEDWETVRAPKMSSTLWHTIGAWKR